MADYTFSPAPVLVEVTGDFAIGAEGIFRAVEGGDPVNIYDLNDSLISAVVVGPKGAHQAFKADIPYGVLDFGSVLLPAKSMESEQAIYEQVARIFTPRVVTGAYTLAADDIYNRVLHSTSATGFTITLPQDSVASIPQEVAIPWRQYGAGQITFAAGTGATRVSRGALYKSAGQYAEGVVTKVAANTWLISGDRAA